jgi:hypothetical protein
MMKTICKKIVIFLISGFLAFGCNPKNANDAELGVLLALGLGSSGTGGNQNRLVGSPEDLQLAVDVFGCLTMDFWGGGELSSTGVSASSRRIPLYLICSM